jgi:hypothetical protein
MAHTTFALLCVGSLLAWDDVVVIRCDHPASPFAPPAPPIVVPRIQTLGIEAVTPDLAGKGAESAHQHKAPPAKGGAREQEHQAATPKGGAGGHQRGAASKAGAAQHRHQPSSRNRGEQQRQH